MNLERTPELGEAIEAAKVECRSLGHTFFGPEHLLLGLLWGESRASRFLQTNGLEIEGVRRQVLARVGRGDQPLETEPLPSLRACGCLRLAEDIARSRELTCDTLILLLALLSDRGSEAAHVVRELGGDLTSWLGLANEMVGDRHNLRPRQILHPEPGLGQADVLIRWGERLAHGEEFLNERIVGQKRAIAQVNSALVRSWAGLGDAGRPLSSFLFLGPPGTGKKKLAQALAELLYQEEDRVVHFHLKGFADEEAELRLIGRDEANPGVLLEAAREYPRAIFFFDDVDHASTRVREIITHILRYGELSDWGARRTEFRDLVVIVAISVEEELIADDSPLGFRQRRGGRTSLTRFEKEFLPELERAVGAELLGSVDEVVLFDPLGPDEFRELVNRWLEVLCRRLRQRRKIELIIEKSVVDALLAEVDRDASQLHRLYVRKVKDVVARSMLAGEMNPGDRVRLFYERSSFSLEVLA